MLLVCASCRSKYGLTVELDLLNKKSFCIIKNNDAYKTQEFKISRHKECFFFLIWRKAFVQKQNGPFFNQQRYFNSPLSSHSFFFSFIETKNVKVKGMRHQFVCKNLIQWWSWAERPALSRNYWQQNDSTSSPKRQRCFTSKTRRQYSLQLKLINTSVFVFDSVLWHLKGTVLTQRTGS